jgi:hypothetical protein
VHAGGSAGGILAETRRGLRQDAGMVLHPWVVHHGLCIMGCASWVVHHGLCIMGCASWVVHHGLCIMGCASWVVHQEDDLPIKRTAHVVGLCLFQRIVFQQIVFQQIVLQIL